ncbi:MAG: hypothetical protein ACREFE_10580 [Limisphaerales bacterium]
MKQNLFRKNCGGFALAALLPGMSLAVCLLMLSWATTAQAQFPQGSYTNNFDTGGSAEPFSGSGSVASWIYWYNTPGGNSPITNDVTTPDPNGGPTAGSLEIYSPFSDADGFGSTNHTQNVFFGTFGNQNGYDFSVEVNFANFDTISFDIYVGTNNAPDANGDFGSIGVGIINASYGYQEMGRPTIPGSASNGWVRLTVPIDHGQDNLASVPGIAFDINSYSGYPTNRFTVWLGNLVMHYSAAPPPPPTLSLTKTVPGLTQFADQKPNYNRQDIRSDTSGTADLSWYGKTPVTYSWTIADFPGAGHAGFQVALNLTPDPVASLIFSDPDWSATNDLWVNINANADGTVTAGIAYKTNSPAANSQLFNPPTQLIPGSPTNGLTVPSAIGTWTLKFTSDTDMTLTAPNGAVTNASLPADVAALYNGPVGVYLYSGAESDANIGQHMTFSAFDITGVGTPVHEDFTSGALSSPFLALNSQDYFYTGDYTNSPPNQQFATSSDAYWLHWTLPDTGFTSVSSPTLSGANWSDLGLANIFSSGGEHYVKIPKANLPGPNQGYFALIQRQFTQLQVLFPGETNAPNTISGKIGTPDPVSVGDGGYVNVTINAVDSTWHIVNTSGDQIQVSTTDGSANLPTPASLANGTVQELIQFQSAGNFTVTATDNTNTNITSNISSSITVNP